MFMVNVGKNTSPMDAYEEEIQVEGDNSSFWRGKLFGR